MNGDGRKRACGMRTIPGDTEIRVVSDGDDDSNSSTMTTTMRTWARAGGVVRAGGGDARGMFCVVRLSCELRMQSQRQGRDKKQQPLRVVRGEGRHPAPNEHHRLLPLAPSAVLLWTAGVCALSPALLHCTARLIRRCCCCCYCCRSHRMFPTHATAHASIHPDPYPEHALYIAAEHARATINVARRGKIRPHVYLSVNPGPAAMPYIVHSTQLPQLQHACPPCLLTGRIEC